MPGGGAVVIEPGDPDARYRFGSVNHGWLCDKGRFAFDAVNSETRLVEPLIRKDGTLVASSWHEALAAVAKGLKKSSSEGGAEAVGVLGGARLTNEGAYAWSKLAKGVLSTDSVDAQMGDGLPAEVAVGLPGQPSTRRLLPTR